MFSQCLHIRDPHHEVCFTDPLLALNKAVIVIDLIMTCNASLHPLWSYLNEIKRVIQITFQISRGIEG